MSEEDEALRFAEEFDGASCYEQLRFVLDLLRDALLKEKDIDKATAALIPLALVTNRVKALEEESSQA